jgi:hypothetical protein
MLLDPTDPADPPLLTFDQNGLTAVSPDYAADPEASERVECSRVLLHLDWPAFVEERRALYIRVLTRVRDGDRVEVAAAKGDNVAKTALIAVARDLIRMTYVSEPYSRAASAYIRQFQDRPWVRRAVLANVGFGGDL